MTRMMTILTDPLSGTLIGICGIALAILFYIRSKKTSLLAYQLTSTTIVGNPGARFSSDLEISYRGHKVPRVTSSKFVVWNSGSEVLYGKDVATGDVLRFVTDHPHIILSVTIQKTSREVNKVDVTPIADGFELRFEFLEKDEGVVCEIVHSGPKDGAKLVGTLIGSKGSPKRVSDRIYIPRTPFWPRAMGYFQIFVGVILFGFSTASELRWVDDAWMAERSDIAGIFVMVLTGGLTLALSCLFWLGRRRYPNGLET